MIKIGTQKDDNYETGENYKNDEIGETGEDDGIFFDHKQILTGILTGNCYLTKIDFNFF